MYKILVNNFVNNSQREIAQIAYYDRARELCEQEALNFITPKEGEKYLAKGIYREKRNITRGYSLVKKETPFFIKITVYHKEPNGLLYTGAITKVLEFFTFRFNLPPTQMRFSEMSELCVDNFNVVLTDLK